MRRTIKLVRCGTVMRLIFLACVRNGVAMQFEVAAAMAWGWLGCSAAGAAMASIRTPSRTLELPKLIPLEELVLFHHIAAALVPDAHAHHIPIFRLV